MEEHEVQAQVDAARKAGFTRGLSTGLFWMGSVCALYSAARTLHDPPKYREVFEQIKIQMPALTLLVLDYGGVAASALIAGVIGCGFATFRTGPASKTVIANGTLLAVALMWTTIMITSLQLPLLSLMQGIGTRR